MNPESATRPRRIVVLDVERDDVDFGGDFAGNTELRFAVADLRRLGHDAQLVRVVAGLTGDRLTPTVRDAISVWVSGVDVVITKVHVDDDLAARLRGGGAQTIFLASEHVRPEVGVYDRVVAAETRLGVLSAVEGLEEPERRTGHGGGRINAGPFANAALFHPETHALDALTGQRRAYERLSLITNRGCPYSRPVASNPRFSGVALGPEVKRFGCSFCEMGGDYAKLDVPDYAEFLALQIRYYAEHAPGAELLVADEAAFDTLAPLLERLHAAGVRGATLLVKARIEGLQKRLDRFTCALALAQERNLTVVVFLMGLESFSDRALSLYNKGVTAVEIGACLEALKALEQRYPESFSISRYRSHGFVLFNPWTTMAELLDNVEAFERHGIAALSGKAAHSRLRLYKWQPLYALAVADGLVTDDPELEHHLGYATGEVPWRFADPRVAQVYREVCDGIAKEGEAAGFGLLATRVRGPSRLETQIRNATAALEKRLGGRSWTIGSVAEDAGEVTISLIHRRDGAMTVQLKPPSLNASSYAETHSWQVFWGHRDSLTAQDRLYLDALCAALREL